MKTKLALILLLLSFFSSNPAQGQFGTRSGIISYPQNWWAGMKNSRVLVILQGQGISAGHATINYPGVSIIKQYPGLGRDGFYLFLDLEISKSAVPGNVSITINASGRTLTHVFPLLQRSVRTNYQLINGSDVIYQIMPDRFANGNTANDNISGFFEKLERSNPSGIHGGDILGITKNVNYLASLGISVVDLTPIYESNQFVQSYDKFAPTNHYNIDPRLGTFEELTFMVSALQTRGIKVILTKILDKTGNQHPFHKNQPLTDWTYSSPEFNKNHETNNVLFADPYASKEDLSKHYKFWENFDLPSLNHNIEEVRRYLIQNVIWWIEAARIDGIKIEDLQLNSPQLILELKEAIEKEYPYLNFIGFPKTEMVVHNHFWKNCLTKNPVFTHVSDVPLYQNFLDVFAEYSNTKEALQNLYRTIASDMIYDDPANELITIGDAHNLTRLFTLAEKDFSIFKMYIGFLLTARGIPTFLYGTEVIMDGLVTGGFGFVRGDMPGGWETDNVSAFVSTTLSPRQREAHLFILNLLDWRKNNPGLMKGKTIHFEPIDDVYAYIRCCDKKKLFVLINNSSNAVRRPDISRFSTSTGKIEKVRDVVTGEVSSGLGNLLLNPKSIRILELTNGEE